MTLAVVRTCPTRWQSYQRLLANLAAVGRGVPVPTFQTPEWRCYAGINSRLTARAALAYCQKHLPDDAPSWAMLLEDDVLIHRELREMLPLLLAAALETRVDRWYLCNRRNPVQEQFRLGPLLVNELGWPIVGSHALLLPSRHLDRMLAAHWSKTWDAEIFDALRAVEGRVLQVIPPVLVEHVGVYSTFDPHHPRKLEVNYASPSDSD
jgi:hypothetical protein